MNRSLQQKHASEREQWRWVDKFAAVNIKMDRARLKAQGDVLSDNLDRH